MGVHKVHKHLATLTVEKSHVNENNPEQTSNTRSKLLESPLELRASSLNAQAVRSINQVFQLLGNVLGSQGGRIVTMSGYGCMHSRTVLEATHTSYQPCQNLQICGWQEPK